MKEGSVTSQLKSLHVANSVLTLQKKSELLIKKLSLQKCLERMEKISKIAEKARGNKDQELEFMYLHRYMSLVQLAAKEPSYKTEEYKKELVNSKKNYDRYAFLYEELTRRYTELKTKSNNDHKLNAVSNENNTVIKENGIQNNDSPGISFPKPIITCKELYHLMKQNEQNRSLLLIDARPLKDFQTSHINFKEIISIPDEVIVKGISAVALGKKLSEESGKLWDKRGSYDKIVIFDWNCTELKINDTKLRFLKEAMVKWDPNIEYKSPPIVLEGGYEVVLDHYPFVTTNANVKSPCSRQSSISNYLDSLTYPIGDLEPKVDPPPPRPQAIAKPTPEPVQAPDYIIIDRSKKPNKSLTIETQLDDEAKDPLNRKEEKNEDENKNKLVVEIKLDDLSGEENGTVSPSKLSEDLEIKVVTPSPKSVNQPKVNEANLSELRRLKPSGTPGQTSHSITPPPSLTMDTSTDNFNDTNANNGLDHIPLKRDGVTSILKRTSSSPNIAQMKDDDQLKLPPSFTRNNKPKSTFYNDRTDATYGNTAVGLTGLKNFANNCYMNSIIQCLSNTEALVKELIDLRKPAMNQSSKTKGRVAQEVINTLRCMWSGDIKVYSVKELKNLMGNIKDIFKGSAHQDSNEFLIILLEHLHEDLNISSSIITKLDGASEDTGEKAWGEFKEKNSSVIQRLFYGQQKSTIACSTCTHSSVTFEPFFNLFVPIPSYEDRITLSDCIKLYMTGEKISGWKCPKCQTERNATKKFDISILPPILVIALKRFTQEDDSWLHKKENVVSYPLEGLNMETFTVKGSEQRHSCYNLYAVSTHSGTLRSGHYKAICKNYINGKWYMFDDQSIDPLAYQSVQNNPEAYILFYRSVS